MNTSKTDIIIKASFIYNFAKHSKWPDSGQENQKFKIAILGDRNVYEEMVDKYSTRAIQSNQSIEMVWLSSAEELQNVQVIFISKAKSSFIDSMMKVASSKNILVISESESINSQKAAISFAVIDNSISFNVNKSQANRCEIQLGNRILDWANNIVE
jgi:hypothetical protein